MHGLAHARRMRVFKLTLVPTMSLRGALADMMEKYEFM